MSDVIERANILKQRYQEDVDKLKSDLFKSFYFVRVNSKFNDETIHKFNLEYQFIITTFIDGILDRFNIKYIVKKLEPEHKTLGLIQDDTYTIRYIFKTRKTRNPFNRIKFNNERQLIYKTLNDIKQIAGINYTVERLDWHDSNILDIKLICDTNMFTKEYNEILNLKKDIVKDIENIEKEIENWYDLCITKDKIIDINDGIYLNSFKCSESFKDSLNYFKYDVFDKIDEFVEKYK